MARNHYNDQTYFLWSPPKLPILRTDAGTNQDAEEESKLADDGHRKFLFQPGPLGLLTHELVVRQPGKAGVFSSVVGHASNFCVVIKSHRPATTRHLLNGLCTIDKR